MREIDTELLANLIVARQLQKEPSLRSSDGGIRFIDEYAKAIGSELAKKVLQMLHIRKMDPTESDPFRTEQLIVAIKQGEMERQKGSQRKRDGLLSLITPQNEKRSKNPRLRLQAIEEIARFENEARDVMKRGLTRISSRDYVVTTEEVEKSLEMLLTDISKKYLGIRLGLTLIDEKYSYEDVIKQFSSNPIA